MTTITIDRSSVRSTAPDLYGMFFEDINRSSDSGLYPEMIRNRSFEDSIPPADTQVSEDGSVFITRMGHVEPFSHGEGDPAWASRHPYTPIPAWYADGAEMELDCQDTLNEHRETSLHVSFSEAGGRIYNIGYCGMAAKKDVPLVFYTFWKAEETGELTVSLEGEEGAVFASCVLPVSGGEYSRAEAVLIPCEDDWNARLVITAARKMDLRIGFTSLMPEHTFLGHGLREDLVQLLKKTNSKFMRYPGGCIVEGLNRATALRFTDLVGPVWERPSIWNLWHYRASYGFGFHEFLQLCEDLNMEALYVVNCGMTCQARQPEFYEGGELMEMLDQTLWAIEYATGDVSTKWGALRARMGHPEPFCLKYIEIGNENDGPEYDKRYKIFYDVLREKHPEITLISNAHTEDRGLPTDFVDEHFYFDWQFFAQSQKMYDHYKTDGPKVFLGEYAITKGEDVATLHAALSETRFLMGCEEHPEVIRLAAYAPLLENVNYKQWNPNLIFFDNHRSAGLPTLHALGMLGESRGTQLLHTISDSEEIIPVKYGYAGFLSYGSGLRMKMPYVNGVEASVCKDILGQWINEGEDLISDNTLLPGRTINSVTRYPIQKILVNTLFSSKKETCMEYTAKVYVDEQTPKFALTVWGHNVKAPEVMSLSENQKEPVTLGDVEYYTWTIEGTKGSCYHLYRYTEWPLGPVRELPLRMGEYNEFRIITKEGGYDCYLNGVLMQQVEDRSYHRVDTVVTEDDKYLYIKLLNNTDLPETVEICHEIPCEREYSWTLLTGDPKDRNTLDKPENVHAVTGKGRMEEDGKLTWEAKSWSFAVLKLTKEKE